MYHPEELQGLHHSQAHIGEREPYCEDEEGTECFLASGVRTEGVQVVGDADRYPEHEGVSGDGGGGEAVRV